MRKFTQTTVQVDTWKNQTSFELNTSNENVKTVIFNFNGHQQPIAMSISLLTDMEQAVAVAKSFLMDKP